MLAVVLALTAAIGYGGSDFAAGLASRSAPVIQITLLASVIGAVPRDNRVSLVIPSRFSNPAPVILESVR